MALAAAARLLRARAAPDIVERSGRAPNGNMRQCVHRMSAGNLLGGH